MFTGHSQQNDHPGHIPPTLIASSGHALDGLASQLHRALQADPLVRAMMESIDGYLLILNDQRQILAANHQFLNDMHLNAAGCQAGLRPGDALGCVHAAEGPAGCGTAKACASCGAALAILATLRDGTTSMEECLATIRRDGSLLAREFRVRTTPLRLAGHELVIMVLTDISGDKRREALERTFFHDILNTLGGLLGWCNLLQEDEEQERQFAIKRIGQLGLRLKDEIENHRRLSDAERGTLAPAIGEIPVVSIMDSVRAMFAAHEVAQGRTLEVADAPRGEAVSTDAALLLRVLGNMVKNALEASAEGSAVKVWFARDIDGRAVFRVHNHGCIPEGVAQHIFQRSFSTKAQRGHGIGTYSMKLFGERYLGGKVGFESTADKGTTFFIRLPAA